MKKLSCIVCGKEMSGRTDKKFCSSTCKNSHHYTAKTPTLDEIAETDAILHANRTILAKLMESRNSKDYHQTTQIALAAEGFMFPYMTGCYQNSQGKFYYYVYDYAWMLHTHQIIRIYKRPNPQKKE